MHHDENTFPPGELENRQDLIVVEFEPLVSEIDLDRRTARFNQLRQLVGQHLGSGVAHDEVKSVVDVGFGAGAPVIVLDDLPQRLAPHLHRKRDDRGVSPAQGGERAATKIVRGAAALPGLLVHVAMGVDAAGQHQPIGSIQRLPRLQGIRSDRRDQAGANADVDSCRARRKDHRSARNRKIVCHGYESGRKYS